MDEQGQEQQQQPEPVDTFAALREQIQAGQPPSLAEVAALLQAYDDAVEALQQIQNRVGDLEFHYDVFEHLMQERKSMIEHLATMGLQVSSVPDEAAGTWCWAWSWRGSEPVAGYDRSITAMIAALETLLEDREK